MPLAGGRRWLLLLALVGLMLLVMLRFTGLRALVATLAEGEWWWVLAAIAAHVVYFVLYALLYRYGFAAVGLESRLRDLLPLLFASIFVNTVTASAGAGAAALFIDDAIKRGRSGARAAVGVILVLAADLVTLVPFILAGVGALFLHRDLQLLGAIGAGIFVLYTVLLSVALVLAGWQRLLLRRLLGWTERLINRVGAWFRRPVLLAEDWAERTARQLTEAAAAIPAHPRALACTLSMGLALHIVNLGGLCLLFPAFHQPVDLGVLVAGFALGITSWVITLIPRGLGAVEGIMALVFVSLGIPGAKAVAIILAFRGLNFWLPLLIGFLLLPSTRSFGTGGRAATLDPQPEPLHPADPSRSGARPDAGPHAPWEGCTALEDR
jgi:hypothetical protein